MYPPDTYPKDTYPVVTYPLETYPLGHITPRSLTPGHLSPRTYTPRTYTPQTLSCPIWFMHHVLITYYPIDPGDLPSNMRYFPRISPNSLKISPKLRATIHIQSLTNVHIFIKTKSFLWRFTQNFPGFNLIYWTPVSG